MLFWTFIIWFSDTTNVLFICDRVREGEFRKLIHLCLHVLKFAFQESQAARKAETISWSSSSVVSGIELGKVKQLTTKNVINLRYHFCKGSNNLKQTFPLIAQNYLRVSFCNYYRWMCYSYSGLLFLTYLCTLSFINIITIVIYLLSLEFNGNLVLVINYSCCLSGGL